MGLLDQVIGSVLGSRRGGGFGGDMGSRGGMSPLMMALLALLASRGMGQGGSGGLGGILGGMLGGGQPGGSHSGGGLSDNALGGMLGGGHAAGSRGGVNPTGVDTSVLYPGGSGVGGGVVDPSAGPFPGRTPTDEMGGGFGSGGGGLGGILGGGLGSLIERFNQSGHGDVIGSWIGTGENRAIAPHQLQGALGDDTVEALSREAGMPRDELLAELSDTLPDVVDRLTPDGRFRMKARWGAGSSPRYFAQAALQIGQGKAVWQRRAAGTWNHLSYRPFCRSGADAGRVSRRPLVGKEAQGKDILPQ